MVAAPWKRYDHFIFTLGLDRATQFASGDPARSNGVFGDNQSRQIKPYRIIAIDVRRVTGHTLHTLNWMAYIYNSPNVKLFTNQCL